MLPKLNRSYAIDAIDAIDAIESIASHRRNPEEQSAEAFLAQLRQSEVETYPAVGEGIEVRLIAAGLVAEGRLVHLAAFAAASDASCDEPNSSGFARLCARRRGMRG